MAAVWQSLRRELRIRWRPLVGLAILLGLVGGAILTAAAGARRTDTAFGRLRDWAHASQLLVVLDQPGPFVGSLRRLPGVQSVGVSLYVDAVLPGARGASVAAFSSPDDSYGVRTDTVKIVTGHMWRPADPSAVMIDQQLAAARHLHPGSSLALTVIPQAPGTGNAEPNLAVTLRFRVAAVVVFDFQVAPATVANSEPAVLLNPRFARSQLARRASYGTELSARLKPGETTAAVGAAAAAAASRDKTVGPGNFDVVDLTDQIDASQQAIRPQAVALGAFALLAGLILVAVISQLLSRQLMLDAADFPVLRALGMSRGQLIALMLARLTAVTLTGGLLAFVLAIACSPLTPIGPARLAEPHSGVEVNLALLGAGTALIVALPVVLVLPVAWRIAARPAGVVPARAARSARPSPLVAALGGRSSVTWGTGLRLAFQPGRGRNAVPVRSAQVGTIVAVAATVAAVVFSASFLHLLASPAQYGQDWQQELDLGFGGVSSQLISKVAALQPGLQAYAAGDYGQLSVNGTIVPAVGIHPFRGAGFTTLLAGRPPANSGQIALGSHTMRELRLRLGDRVRVRVAGQGAQGAVTRSMTVTGEAVLPAFGQGSIVATDLGNGALVSPIVLSVPYPQTGCPGSVTCYNFVLARYRPGVKAAVAREHLLAAINRLGCPPQVCHVVTDQRPTDIVNYAKVRQTPLVLGLVLALLAIGTLAHVLLTSVRRRAGELAILKVLGMIRAQVLTVVLWQALAFSLAAVAVGLPLGIAAGRWAWVLFAGSAGAPAEPAVPVLPVLAFVPATLLLAALVAALPGRAAGRLRPAAALRAE
jgi:ABC-type lipoprotein release transport system permease subunit